MSPKKECIAIMQSGNKCTNKAKKDSIFCGIHEPNPYCEKCGEREEQRFGGTGPKYVCPNTSCNV